MAAQPDSSQQTIRYFQSEPRYAYVIELLTLILDETRSNYGPYKLQPLYNINYRRGTTLLTQNSQVDIMVSSPSEELMNTLQPILIPIERGLLGYRVFFIRRTDQQRFAAITTLDELRRQFTAGFGAGWVDRGILEANGIPLVVNPRYRLLYKMLIGNRFDYFPRGINEIHPELKRFEHEHPELSIESTLAFYYPYPRYFFVHKNNQQLKERIETGFHRIRENGVFQEHFEAYHRTTLERIRTQKRRVFVLHNPLLPEGLPLPDTSSWLPQEHAKP